MFKVLFLKFVVTAFIALSLSSCSQKSETQLVQQQLFSFGTLVNISIWSENKQGAQDAIGEISAMMDELHHAWQPYKGGPLTEANEQFVNPNKVFELDEIVIPLIEPASILSKQSQLSASGQSLFNPAIGRLVQLWGFDQLGEAHGQEQQWQPPSQAEIDAILQSKPQMSQLKLQEKSISSSNPQIKLDFGAFAKGVAVNRAIAKLEQLGFHNALFNAGGDLKVIGQKGDRAWRIGIRNPFYQEQQDQPVIAAITMQSHESAFTSGDYERFFEYQGKAYHHILDPRTGYPAKGFHSVTVLHEDAARADAAATALFIAGEQNWAQIASQMGIEYIMLIDHKRNIIMTEAMQTRVQILNEKLNINIVANPKPSL